MEIQEIDTYEPIKLPMERRDLTKFMFSVKVNKVQRVS